jgi:hypothetical protein
MGTVGSLGSNKGEAYATHNQTLEGTIIDLRTWLDQEIWSNMGGHDKHPSETCSPPRAIGKRRKKAKRCVHLKEVAPLSTNQGPEPKGTSDPSRQRMKIYPKVPERRLETCMTGMMMKASQEIAPSVPNDASQMIQVSTPKDLTYKDPTTTKKCLANSN